jgi:hypothetical protein
LTMGVGSGTLGFAGVALTGVLRDGRAASSSNGMFVNDEARPSAAKRRMTMDKGWRSGLAPVVAWCGCGGGC